MPTTQTIPIDLNTRGATPVAFTHQGDTARTFVFEVYNNGEEFDVSSYSVRVAALLPADNGYYVIAGENMATGDTYGNTITVTLPAEYTQKFGNGVLTLVLTGSGATIRPINIDLRIQKSADAPETIAGASDFVPVLQRYMAEDMQTYINAWLDAHPEAMQYYISGSKLVLDENGILSIQNDTDEIVEALDLDTLRAEVTDLKSDLNYNHAAEPGYVLRATNTGHGNEWAMVGTPTDAQAETAINKWLDEHPEATTTVQDGALTEPKFSNALKLKTIKDYVTPEMHGAKGDGATDDYAKIMLAVAEAISKKIPLVFPSGDGYLIQTPIVIESGIDIFMNSPIIYSGNGTALTLGKAGERQPFYENELTIMVTSGNGLDYKSGSVGLKMINFMDCRVNILSVDCFEENVQIISDGGAVSYNIFTLGRIFNSIVGLHLKSQNGGWTNENTYIAGRMFCYSNASYRNSYIAIKISGSATNPLNNNTFIDPCFEGANIGIYIDGGIYNRFLNVRSESTTTVLKTIGNSDNYNYVTVGYGTYTEENESPTSAIIKPNYYSYANMQEVYNSGNFADYCFSNASWMHIGKQLCSLNTTFGTIQNYYGKRYANYITLTVPLGIMVDTSVAKKFTADIGAISGTDARIVLIMFDENGQEISEGLKYGSQIPFSSRTLGGLNFFVADTSCLNKRPLLEVPNECEKMYIGFTGNVHFTNFRVFANSYCTVIPNAIAQGLTVAPTCEGVAGDFCPNSNPSNNTLGWVCTGGTNWTAVPI